MYKVVLYFERNILKTLHISKFISFESDFPITMLVRWWEQVL